MQEVSPPAEAMVTDGTSGVVTVIVIALLCEVSRALQGALLVSMQVITEPEDGV